mmetsp:Transcript_75387/g.218926  ORF Transcript_75387/g.218926 Transcript_75387/m.218926 type:complete len:239 (-) Transcript_75387:358-1074(-)
MGNSSAPILNGAGFSSAVGVGFNGCHAARGRRKTWSGKGPNIAAIGHLPMRSGCCALYSNSPDAVRKQPNGSTCSEEAVTKATCMPRNGNMPRMAATATSAWLPSSATKTSKLARSAPLRIMSLVMRKKASYSALMSSGLIAGHEYETAFFPARSAELATPCARSAAKGPAAATMCNEENSEAPLGNGVLAINVAAPSGAAASMLKYGTLGSASTASGRAWNSDDGASDVEASSPPGS